MFKPELRAEEQSSFLERKIKRVTFYLEDFLRDEGQTEQEKRLYEYLSLIKETFDDQDNYIDHGGAANVYSFAGRDVCIKIMKNRHRSSRKEMYNLGNKPITEFSLMERLHNFERGGVRSPIAEACVESEESSMIIMEKLDAVNMQHILNGSEGMPESFDRERFYESLEEYIEGLHEEKEIAHMDLFPRNVMIDRKTGVAYVIDFGRSLFLNDLSEEEKQKSMKDDWNKYDELCLELEKFSERETSKTESTLSVGEVYAFGSRRTEVAYSEEINTSARHIAQGLLESGGEIANISLGANRKDLFVSRDKELVVGLHQFVIDGIEFWVGMRR